MGRPFETLPSFRRSFLHRRGEPYYHAASHPHTSFQDAIAHARTHTRTGPLRNELGDLLRVNVGGLHWEAVSALDLVRLRGILPVPARGPDRGRNLVRNDGGHEVEDVCRALVRTRGPLLFLLPSQHNAHA